MSVESEKNLSRRVAGYHDIRMDGMLDLVIRAKGKSVLDIGCNRGLVGFEFANNGATCVHGIDNYAHGIETATQLFADLRGVDSQFAAIDLTQGPKALKAFDRKYDIMVMLATYHKLRRVMKPDHVIELMQWFGERTAKWFGWRATSDKPHENEQEMRDIDRVFEKCGLKRIHTSYISHTLGVAAIWERPH